MKKKMLAIATVSSLATAAYLAIGNYFYEYALKSKRKQGTFWRKIRPKKNI